MASESSESIQVEVGAFSIQQTRRAIDDAPRIAIIIHSNATGAYGITCDPHELSDLEGAIAAFKLARIQKGAAK